jgi:hypothetical protein
MRRRASSGHPCPSAPTSAVFGTTTSFQCQLAEAPGEVDVPLRLHARMPRAALRSTRKSDTPGAPLPAFVRAATSTTSADLDVGNEIVPDRT